MKIELIFPSTSSVNRNWFPVNCGCSLAHPGCATQLEKLTVTGWGRETEKHLGGAEMVQYKVLSHHHLLSAFSVSLLPSPLPFGLSYSHWADTAGVQREVTPGFGLHCHVHRKHKISSLCVSDEAQALGMIVAIYRALWWCSQQQRVATSAMLESNKSIPAFPVSSLICKDACLCFKAQEFPSVLQCSRGRRGVCVCIFVCVRRGEQELCSRGKQGKEWGDTFLPCANTWQTQDKEVQVSVHAFI